MPWTWDDDDDDDDDNGDLIELASVELGIPISGPDANINSAYIALEGGFWGHHLVDNEEDGGVDLYLLSEDEEEGQVLEEIGGTWHTLEEIGTGLGDSGLPSW